MASESAKYITEWEAEIQKNCYVDSNILEHLNISCQKSVHAFSKENQVIKAPVLGSSTGSSVDQNIGFTFTFSEIVF
jgi:hypothetical protein